MGGCNSSVGQNLERKCTGQLRRKKNRSSSSTSSSSSSSSLSSSAQNEAPESKEQGEASELTAEKIEEIPEGAEKPHETEVGKGDEEKEKGEEQSKEDQPVVVDANSGSLEPVEEAEERKKRFEKLKEGVDFIETEEDAEAVESAVVKIQSTFRGKKIRSKLGQNKQTENSNNNNNNSTSNNSEQEKKSADSSKDSNPLSANSKTSAINRSDKSRASEDTELNEQVAGMQVNDNKKIGGTAGGADGSKDTGNAPLTEDGEAQRAATKIQAGFKGYKTRKELEGKLSASGQQQTATGGVDSSNDEEKP